MLDIFLLPAVALLLFLFGLSRELLPKHRGKTWGSHLGCDRSSCRSPGVSASRNSAKSCWAMPFLGASRVSVLRVFGATRVPVTVVHVLGADRAGASVVHILDSWDGLGSLIGSLGMVASLLRSTRED